MRYLTLLSVIAVSSLTACHSSSKTAAQQNNSQQHSNNQAANALQGRWELNYVSGTSVSVEELYRDRQPFINFDLAEQRVNGNSGCNSFSGPLKTNGNRIDFTGPMMMTKMFCDGGGEQIFMDALHKVTGYSITDGNTLNLISGDIAVMRFIRK